MRIRDFIAKYRPNSDESLESIESVLTEFDLVYVVYECPDAMIFLIRKDDHSGAYLLFRKFSRSVFNLMVKVCRVERGTLVAETEDSRIAKWLVRIGFDRVFSDDGSTVMKFVRKNHV